MKPLRNLPGSQLVKALEQPGFQSTCQTASHARLSCALPKEHHLAVLLLDPLRIGAFAAILNGVATHYRLPGDVLITQLSGR